MRRKRIVEEERGEMGRERERRERGREREREKKSARVIDD